MQDDEFVRSFTAMIIGFVILTIALIILAIIVARPVMSTISESKNVDRDKQTAMRVAPVGSLAIGEAAVEQTAAADSAGAADAVEMDGPTVYQNACAACHATGVAGAPAFGDAAAWKDRIGQGMDMLVEHAINGYQGSAGYMPPKGGNAALTDDQVSDAVEHMTNSVK